MAESSPTFGLVPKMIAFRLHRLKSHKTWSKYSVWPIIALAIRGAAFLKWFWGVNRMSESGMGKYEGPIVPRIRETLAS